MLSAEIGLYSYKVNFFEQEDNDQERCEELDTLEGRCLEAAKAIALARNSATKYFNRKVKARQFHECDWVL